LVSKRGIVESDVVTRFLLPEAGVRGAIVCLADAFDAVLGRHAYPPNVIAPLGEALTAAVLLSAHVKLDGSLILQIQGDGPLHTLVAHATSDRTLRGLARFTGDVPDGAMKHVFGEGKLVITVDSGGGERYQGIVLIEGTSIATSIEEYFSQSEQLRTRLWLGAKNGRAAGLLLQELGDARDNEHLMLEPDEGWIRATTLANTLTEDEMLELPSTEILRRLFVEEDLRIFDADRLAFKCGCSFERINAVLRSLGRAEVDSIVEEKGVVEVDCEFCNQNYRVEAADVDSIFDESAGSTDSDTIH